VALPFYIAGGGIIASIVGTYFVRTQEGASQEDLLKAMRMGTVSASMLIIVMVGAMVGRRRSKPAEPRV
jgi:K(+)-stimulated pyrophosphate-energized sodium pump